MHDVNLRIPPIFQYKVLKNSTTDKLTHGGLKEAAKYIGCSIQELERILRTDNNPGAVFYNRPSKEAKGIFNAEYVFDVSWLDELKICFKLPSKKVSVSDDIGFGPEKRRKQKTAEPLEKLVITELTTSIGKDLDPDNVKQQAKLCNMYVSKELLEAIGYTEDLILRIATAKIVAAHKIEFPKEDIPEDAEVEVEWTPEAKNPLKIRLISDEQGTEYEKSADIITEK
jgi:hypothetical protein